jgi:hypothetical protein
MVNLRSIVVGSSLVISAFVLLVEARADLAGIKACGGLWGSLFGCYSVRVLN